jgi:dUTP pyrophosphatase
MKKIKVRVWSNQTNPTLPEYKTSLAAGMDVHLLEETTLHPKQIKIAPTGLFVEIPEGYEIQVRPRSGTVLKLGVSVANSPGTIDADYRGEIGIMLENKTDFPVILKQGERVAQLVLCEVPQIVWEEVETLEELTKTDRGAGAYGSTGV